MFMLVPLVLHPDTCSIHRSPHHLIVFLTMGVSRRPVTGALALLTVVGVVFFMFSPSTDSSLGAAVPINISKYGLHQPEPVQNVLEQGANFDPNTDLEVTDSSKATPGEMEGISLQESDEIPELTDTPFMPKMANETLKAQLGNAAWRLFHTILARYPEKPSLREQATLSQYLYSFAQVYPCGDCARHFQQLLTKYPPQVKSRKTAALWGCHMHNKVNERLGKDEYDCTTILTDYDCGCGGDEKEQDETLNGSMEDLRSIKLDEVGGEQELG